MNCPECGTKIGVFRRKFSNTAFCSEACRQTAHQKQNQASLALLLSNKNRHLAQLQAAPAPPPAPPKIVEEPPQRAREAVHSGVLAGFAPFRRPGAHQAPAGVALLDEAPAEVDLSARWQDAVLHAIRPGGGITGRVLTAMSCLQPLAASPLDSPAPAEADWGARWQDAVRHAIPPCLGITGWVVTALSCLQPLAATPAVPSGPLNLTFAATLSRVCDTLLPVWEPPAAEPELAPQPEVEAPSQWIAPSLVPARLPYQWLGLSAASEFESPVQWPQFRPAPERPEFAPFAACKCAPASLPAGPCPSLPAAGTPCAFDRLPAIFNAVLTARSPKPALAAISDGPLWRRQAVSHARTEEPGADTEEPVRWIHRDRGVGAPRLGKLAAAPWLHIHCSATTGSAVIKTNSDAARWRYEVCRSNGVRLPAVAPNWNLLVPPPVEAAPDVVIEVAIEPAVAVVGDAAAKVTAATAAPPPPLPAPPARPSRSVKDRLAGMRESVRNFPDWTRRLAFHMAWLLPLALAAVWFGPAMKAGASGAVPAQWSAVKAAIQRRATIDLEDDFRAGLNHWNGASGWAKTWSYDATGLLHPGALALYLESAAMSDYTVEFLAIIEKRALGWTYRTADMRNYYAAKLALTRRGNIPTLDLERYAVIDGRQDRRVQLPLPVVLSNITSFRVRTEVQGSRFTTYLNGKVIDGWSDERLARGGVGFFAEPDAVVGLQWVRVIQGDDLIGRVCAQVSSVFADKKLREALH